MTIRDFINAVLTVIGAASLTDVEFSALEIESAAYDVETYTAILEVLDARELVSNTRDRLYYLFLARGVAVSEVSAGTSKILVGHVLC